MDLCLALLDWEKAFDKVDQKRMGEALERLGLPDKMIRVILALYRKPQFRVRHGAETSQTHEHKFGIRQGCPLSPYLFILVMHVMFWDIKERSGNQINRGAIPGLSFAEILYADDTLLILRTKESLEKLLHEIELESEYYGLRLNLAKCELIEMDGNQEIEFRNGDQMKKAEKQNT